MKIDKEELPGKQLTVNTDRSEMVTSIFCTIWKHTHFQINKQRLVFISALVKRRVTAAPHPCSHWPAVKRDAAEVLPHAHRLPHTCSSALSTKQWTLLNVTTDSRDKRGSLRLKRSGGNEGRHLKESGEDVKLKDGDVVVAGEVNGGLEGHGFQARADRVEFVQRLSKELPLHDGPAQSRATQGHLEQLPTKAEVQHVRFEQIGNSLVPEWSSPEFCCVCLGDSEVIPLEQATGEDGF